MKHKLFTKWIGFGLGALLLAASPAGAQQRREVAAIPFEFEAGGIQYPEGHYTIELMGASRAVKISHRESGRSAFIGMPIEADGKSDSSSGKLVFIRTAAGLQLKEVWFSGGTGMTTRTTPEKELSAKVVIGLK